MARNKPMMVCAWCGKVVRKGPVPASHGICAPCRIALLARRPVRIRFTGME